MRRFETFSACGAVVYSAVLAVSGCEGGELDEAEALDEIEAVALSEAMVEVETEAVELGRMLFWDPVLSGEMDVACATCHHPDHGYADGRETSRGVGAVGLGPSRDGGETVDRNAPTVLNTAFVGATRRQPRPGAAAAVPMPLFWDLRADGLEEQALAPIQSGVEMRGFRIGEDEILDVVVGRVAAIPAYRALFADAFGDDAVTTERIASALGDYQRSLTALGSPFDRYLAGEPDAMTQQQRRGMRRFAEVGCADCHSGPMLSDFEAHGIGVVSRLSDGSLDEGAGEGEFRTPPLRNVALTAPYMHDGSLEDLRAVLEHYDDISRRGGGGGNNGGGEDSPFDIDRRARDLRLGGGDFDEIIAFLEALTAPDFDRSVPSSVPSGLPPGGALSAGAQGIIAGPSQ